MFGIDEAIGSVVKKIRGGDEGARIRGKTLLPVDKIISAMIFVIPISLIGFQRVFVSEVFSADSCHCAPAQNRSVIEGSVLGENGNQLGPGLGYGNRFYMFKYCWERPYFHQTASYVSSENALIWHKNFPYVLLVLTAFASIPLILWTYTSGPQIEQQVTLFSEFIETLVRFLIKAMRNKERYTIEIEEQAKKEGRVFEAPTNEQVIHSYIEENYEHVALSFGHLRKFIQSKADTKGCAGGMVVRLFAFKFFNALGIILVSLIVYKISISPEVSKSTFICNVDWAEDDYEAISTHNNANPNNFHDSYDSSAQQKVVCSISGVQVRQWISILWVSGYTFLIMLLIIGTWADLRAMKFMADRRDVLELFALIFPDVQLGTGGRSSRGLTDLKLLTVLVSNNSQQKLVRYLFNRLETAKTFGTSKPLLTQVLDLFEHDLKEPEFGKDMAQVVKSLDF